MTPNSSPPPNDEGEYEPISKTEDTGDQLIGKFQNKSLRQSGQLIPIGLKLLSNQKARLKHQFENPS